MILLFPIQWLNLTSTKMILISANHSSHCICYIKKYYECFLYSCTGECEYSSPQSLSPTTYTK